MSLLAERVPLTRAYGSSSSLNLLTAEMTALETLLSASSTVHDRAALCCLRERLAMVARVLAGLSATVRRRVCELREDARDAG